MIEKNIYNFVWYLYNAWNRPTWFPTGPPEPRSINICHTNLVPTVRYCLVTSNTASLLDYTRQGMMYYLDKIRSIFISDVVNNFCLSHYFSLDFFNFPNFWNFLFFEWRGIFSDIFPDFRYEFISPRCSLIFFYFFSENKSGFKYLI